MTDTKSPFASKTLWGVLLQAVASVLILLKIDLPGLEENLEYFAEAAAIIVGAGLGVWGRITAKKDIKISTSDSRLPLFLLFVLGALALLSASCAGLQPGGFQWVPATGDQPGGIFIEMPESSK